MIEKLEINKYSLIDKDVFYQITTKLNQIIDTINEQEVEHKIHKRQLDFIMENTEVPTVVDNDANKTAYKFLKELYK